MKDLGAAIAVTWLFGVVALWFTLLWLALREPEQGHRGKTEDDQARDA